MEIKQIQLIPKGMNQDLSISKFSPEFSYENRNIRITAQNDDSLLSIQNEKGTEEVPITVLGRCIGYGVINKYLILFTTQNSPKTDRIYRIKDLTEVTLLTSMDLGFDEECPIRTLPLYETDTIQKMYFYDNKNQPRVINVVSPTQPQFPSGFNFAPDINYSANVIITKQLTGGLFHSGVIQYAVSAFNPHRAETALFYISPLQYITTDDRALSPEQLSSNSFRLSLTNLDVNYEYLRVYSIHRSSFNNTPDVKVVGDYKTNNGSVTLVDTGTSGYAVDPTLLLFLGAEAFTAKSMAVKDNTLFGGNITMLRKASLTDLNLGNNIGNITWEHRSPVIIEDKNKANNPAYTYIPNSINNTYSIAHFKRGQYYRFGIIAQHKTGKLSEPFYIGNDIKCPLSYLTKYEHEAGHVKLFLNKARLTINQATVQKLFNAGYTRIIPVMVQPGIQDRMVIAQGIATNTLAFNHLRDTNAPYSLNDYLFRPALLDKPFNQYIGTSGGFISPSTVPYGHLLPIGGELNCTISPTSLTTQSPVSGKVAPNPAIVNPYQLFSDENIINIYSPDIEHNESIGSVLSKDINCRIVGLACVTNGSYNNITNIESGTESKYLGNSLSLRNYNPDLSELGFDYAFTTLYRNSIFYPDPYFNIGNASEKKELLYNKSSSRCYSLFNIMLEDGYTYDPLLDYPLYRPAFADRNNTTKVLPLTTRQEDFNGNIIYNKDIDEVLIHRINTTIQDPTSTRLATKSTSHIVTALGLEGDYSNISHTLPQFTYNGGLGLAFPSGWDSSEIPSVSSEENKVFVHVYPGLAKDRSFTTDTLKFLATYSYAVRVDNLHNMQDDDIIYIWPKLTWRTRNTDPTSSPNTINVQFNPNIQLTKAQYNALPDYNEIPGSKKLTLTTDIGVTTDHAGNEDNAITTDPVDFYVNTPTIQSTRPDFFIINFVSNRGGYSYGIGGAATTIYYPNRLYWRSKRMGYTKRFLNLKALRINSTNNGTLRRFPYLPIVELRKPETPEILNGLYGGKDDNAIINNLWRFAGPGVRITSPNSGLAIEYLDGDTYVQRYDCLKTIPETEETKNRPTHIASFLCETYTNIDGRYDRNRYNLDNTTARFSNFGLINPVYSQYNNYFSYRILDSRLFTAEKFPNQIVWSQPKNNGELVDSWTNLDFLSIADLDGSLGSINALVNHNDHLLAFQDKGLATILFNPRVQIATSDNVPIEVTNSGKFEGYKYVSNSIGATDERAILSGKNSLYFIDSINKTFNVFTGEGIRDLTESMGMHNWGINNINANTKLYHNLLHNDIYIDTGNDVLNYSETLGGFVSFFDYTGNVGLLPYFNNWLSIRNAGNNTKLYRNNTGIYNNFYGTLKPSYIHYRLSPEFTRDKIFNNIEYRSDIYDNGVHTPDRTFDTIRAWNEYQDSGDVLLESRKNIFRKFRVWRGYIPRQQHNRNRMRNTWINLRLTLSPKLNENIKLTMHDIIVSYTV